MISYRDIYFMGRALELARLRKGLTHPNPTVGCVVVKDGKIISEGYHERAGAPHAEVVALSKAGQNAKDSTLYVTLEPCSHYGRTPPCTNAIIEAGVKRVVVATLDPNPKVMGSGIERLRAAGIQVDVGVLEEEARQLNEDFFVYITQNRPYITLKWAQSIDGSLATKTGDSKWITSRESREFAHRLRAEATAILVGVNTVVKDDPLLTVRAFLWERQPIRVVLDPYLRTPLQANLMVDTSAKTILVTCSQKEDKVKKLEDMGVSVVKAECVKGRVDLRWLMRWMHQQEIMHLMVEGGARTLEGFIEEGLWDRIVVFLGPLLIGNGIRVRSPGAEKLMDAIPLRKRRLWQLGEDVAIEYTRAY